MKEENKVMKTTLEIEYYITMEKLIICQRQINVRSSMQALKRQPTGHGIRALVLD